jgi:hypothetical protein
MGTNLDNDVVTGDGRVIKTPEDAIYAAAARRFGDKYRRQPWSYFPPAEANAPATANVGGVPDHLKPLPPEGPGRQFAKAPDNLSVQPNTPMFGNPNNKEYGRDFRTHPMQAYADTVAGYGGAAGNLVSQAFGDRLAPIRQKAMNGEISWEQFRQYEKAFQEGRIFPGEGEYGSVTSGYGNIGP